ncbi:MAG: TonB-dependent receptor plug domain-containing protein, partial [Pseudomonadales bacterium]|nr:TonB-dependent receptor plug domain-containing protein [Pseudomonadales bacterium]
MPSPLFRASCATLFLSLVLNQASAQPDSEVVEIITVSATPINIDDAGSSVSVISRQDILDRNAASIQDLLREVPGFSVSQQGSHGAVSQVRVRGAEANQVLVMINGIEVNDPAQGSEFDFSQISTNDIERIEIVRGPQSALWGSDAMAGV